MGDIFVYTVIILALIPDRIGSRITNFAEDITDSNTVEDITDFNNEENGVKNKDSNRSEGSSGNKNSNGIKGSGNSGRGGKIALTDHEILDLIKKGKLNEVKQHITEQDLREFFERISESEKKSLVRILGPRSNDLSILRGEGFRIDDEDLDLIEREQEERINPFEMEDVSFESIKIQPVRLDPYFMEFLSVRWDETEYSKVPPYGYDISRANIRKKLQTEGSTSRSSFDRSKFDHVVLLDRNLMHPTYSQGVNSWGGLIWHQGYNALAERSRGTTDRASFMNDGSNWNINQLTGIGYMGFPGWGALMDYGAAMNGRSGYQNNTHVWGDPICTDNIASILMTRFSTLIIPIPVTKRMSNVVFKEPSALREAYGYNRQKARGNIYFVTIASSVIGSDANGPIRKIWWRGIAEKYLNSKSMMDKDIFYTQGELAKANRGGKTSIVSNVIAKYDTGVCESQPIEPDDFVGVIVPNSLIFLEGEPCDIYNGRYFAVHGKGRYLLEGVRPDDFEHVIRTHGKMGDFRDNVEYSILSASASESVSIKKYTIDEGKLAEMVSKVGDIDLLRSCANYLRQGYENDIVFVAVSNSGVVATPYKQASEVNGGQDIDGILRFWGIPSSNDMSDIQRFYSARTGANRYLTTLKTSLESLVDISLDEIRSNEFELNSNFYENFKKLSIFFSQVYQVVDGDEHNLPITQLNSNFSFPEIAYYHGAVSGNPFAGKMSDTLHAYCDRMLYEISEVSNKVTTRVNNNVVIDLTGDNPDRGREGEAYVLCLRREVEFTVKKEANIESL